MDIDNIEKYVDKRRTICEVIREVYDLSYGIGDETIQEETRIRLKTAYKMAKKMDKKLHEYKFGWDKDFWEDNKDYEKDLGRRGKR